MIIMDTHRAVEKIMVAGLSKEAAEAIVYTVNSGSNTLATKRDLTYEINLLTTHIESKINDSENNLKTEINAINTNINWLKAISIANFTVVIGTAIAILLK